MLFVLFVGVIFLDVLSLRSVEASSWRGPGSERRPLWSSGGSDLPRMAGTKNSQYFFRVQKKDRFVEAGQIAVGSSHSVSIGSRE